MSRLYEVDWPEWMGDPYCSIPDSGAIHVPKPPEGWSSFTEYALGSGICKHCKTIVPKKELANKRQYCYECRFERRRDRTADEQHARYRKTKPIRMLQTARASANRRNLDFNITVDDIIIPTHCPLLGIELSVSQNGPSPNSPSLDRIDNKQGYIKGNVWVISQRANMIKSSATWQEIALVANGLRAKMETAQDASISNIEEGRAG